MAKAKAKAGQILAAAVSEDQLVKGTMGPDNLRGNAGKDTLNGLLGDDVLDGGSGNDNIDGGKGIDTVTFTDDVDGVAATHGVIVNLGSDRLKNVSVPGIEPTTVQARQAIDSYGFVDKLFDIENVTGTDFADYIVGSDLANRLLGQGGNDTLLAGKGNDFVDGGEGDDLIEGGRGDDELHGGADNDTIKGDDGNDSIFGEAGNDDLIGGNGADAVDGGEGDDLITDAAGKDRYTGGIGADRFDFNVPNQIGNSDGTRDVITDFKLGGEADLIDLSTIDARPAVTGNQAFTFIAAEGAAFSHTQGEIIWDKDEVNNITIIKGDINGDGVAEFQIELTGLVDLAATDFIL